MAYSEGLAARIRHLLERKRSVEEKKMFGGLGFLLQGNLCVGVWKDSLVARVGPKQYEAALQEPYATEFDITGRAMSGWVLVAATGIEDDDLLQEWVKRAVTFVRTLPAK